MKGSNRKHCQMLTEQRQIKDLAAKAAKTSNIKVTIIKK